MFIFMHNVDFCLNIICYTRHNLQKSKMCTELCMNITYMFNSVTDSSVLR